MKATGKNKKGHKEKIGFKQGKKREREPDIEADDEAVNRKRKIQEPEDVEKETEDKPKRRERVPDIEAENEDDVKNDKEENAGNKERGANPDATDNRSDSPN